MTNWLPDLSQGSGPLYLRLADRIEDDISGGALPTGTKLPPQRDLAFDIGVTIGTVGRAYALVRERGLVSGEVGRGTYVLGGGRRPSRHPPPIRRRAARGRPLRWRPSGKICAWTAPSAPDVGQSDVDRAARRCRSCASIADEVDRLHAHLAERLAARPAAAGCAAASWTPDPAHDRPDARRPCGDAWRSSPR